MKYVLNKIFIFATMILGIILYQFISTFIVAKKH